MINGKDIYEVLAAIVPLYVAMILAYGSVRWWKIFTPDQCSGINRFVAVFAVPLLSFHFISSNDIYSMNYHFLAADTLQKAVILVLLILWNIFTKYGSLDWTITLFSLSTLPNTLVMGVPTLKAMYGDFSASLMVQIVVLQCVIWYTVMLFLFEYRAAKILISQQFPETAGSITSIKADSDVTSLGGREPLQADAEIGEDGKLHVVLKRSASNLSMFSSFNKSHLTNPITPRGSNLTGVEIYSVHSSREFTPRSSSFNQTDLYPMFRNSGHERFNSGLVSNYHPQNPMVSRSISGGGKSNKELHMFVWSSSASSPASEGNLRHAVNNRPANSADFMATDVPHETAASKDVHQLIEIMSPRSKANRERLEIEEGNNILYPSPTSQKKVENEGDDDAANKKQQTPSTIVLTRLILIMVWRKLIRNPNTYASFLGLAWSLISFRWNVKLPSIIAGSISILSNTGLGMAMFSLGLFMALQPKIIACGKKAAVYAMAVRFLVGPAVNAATATAVGIRGVLLRVAIVQAALPQGLVPFVFAKEYSLHADLLSTAVIFGMVVALPVTIIYYVLMGL